MILPSLALPVTPDVFTIHLRYIINQFEVDNDCMVNIQRKVRGEYQERYTLSLISNDLEKSNNESLIIGQIEVFPLDKQDLEVQVASDVSNVDALGIKFFNDFYDEIYRKWKSYAFRIHDCAEITQAMATKNGIFE